MKETLREMVAATIAELALEPVMAEAVTLEAGRLRVATTSIDLAACDRLFVAAIGKAARPMAGYLARLLAPIKTSGISGVVITSVSEGQSPDGFETFVGGHPYPNEQSVVAADHVLERAAELQADDLFVCLLSGGGSAICESPIDPRISLADTRALYEILVTCGADIVDMNVLRKHLSRLKGGRLALAAHPARQLTLYVSDVPPGQPSTVASGPTMPDESTVGTAYETAARLGIVPRLPTSIRGLFEQKQLLETPKADHKAFSKSEWHCLLDNQAALDSLESKARARGWVVERDLSVDDMPLGEAADALLRRAEGLAAANRGKTIAVTSGGELSSPVTGDGRGGRNSAFVLKAAQMLTERGLRASMISAGTDGIDGNSPAAGAVADETSIKRGSALAMDPADFEQRSDSFNYFEALGDAIITGPTGNNVRDLRMIVIEPAPSEPLA